MGNDRVITHEQLAKELGVDKRWLRDNVLSNGCPHVRIGHVALLRYSEVCEWIGSLTAWRSSTEPGGITRSDGWTQVAPYENDPAVRAVKTPPPGKPRRSKKNSEAATPAPQTKTGEHSDCDTSWNDCLS